MPEPTIKKLKKFVSDYSDFESDHWEERWNAENRELEHFKSKFFHFKGGLEEIAKTTSPYFNIFSVLNVSHYETRLHTPFLEYLLNPNGSHGQGALFRDRFFREILPDKIYGQIDSYTIQQEQFAKGKGQLDLIIKYSQKGARKVIVIENKIYAGDQKDQLDRYYKYVSQDLGYSNEEITLIFLTVWGTQVSPYSLGCESLDNWPGRHVYCTKSYRNDIKRWLEGCSGLVKSNHLVETLNQYIKTIERL